MKTSTRISEMRKFHFRRLNALPPYRPDDELQQEVERALFDITPLHILRLFVAGVTSTGLGLGLYAVVMAEGVV